MKIGVNAECLMKLLINEFSLKYLILSVFHLLIGRGVYSLIHILIYVTKARDLIDIRNKKQFYFNPNRNYHETLIAVFFLISKSYSFISQSF